MKKIILVVLIFFFSFQAFSDVDLIQTRIDRLTEVKSQIRRAIGLLTLISEGEIVMQEQLKEFSRDEKIYMLREYNETIDSIIALQDSISFEALKVEINE